MGEGKGAGRRRRAAALVAVLGLAAMPLAARIWAPAELKADEAHALTNFPESASVVRRQLAAAHDAQDRAGIAAGLHRLAALGYAPTQATIDLLFPALGEDDRAALALRFAANRTPIAASRLYADVPAAHRLIEGIARDPQSGRLFVASVVDRSLLVLDQGAWREVAGVDGGSLFGMAVDPRRRRLWVASGVVAQTPHPETAFRGLIGLDLDSLRVVARVATPASLGDAAAASDGTIYASDPEGGTIFRLRPGAAAAEILVPAGRFLSPQGMVPAEDGRRLYVADYGYGIGIVDLATGHISRLAARGVAMLDGVDGMIGDGRDLIAVQNGVNPHRIVRLALDRTGTQVLRTISLERANPAWGEPTLATRAGRELLYVADGQWDRYGAGGAATGAAHPTPIRALSVEAGFHRGPGERHLVRHAVRMAHQGERHGAVESARPGAAGDRLFLDIGPGRHEFAAHRTTLLTGLVPDHRLIHAPIERPMS